MRKCNRFFELLAASGLAVTYDEVRLKTGFSKVAPGAVSLETRFSRRVSMKIPVASAAMDTVTESPMAIAMAKLGGIGVIHRNLTPSEQKEEVRRVKYHLSGMIASPITVQGSMTLHDINAMRRERRFSFHSFPVLDAEGKLVGLLTQNDFDFCEDPGQTAEQVMTRDLITARYDISMDDAYLKMREAKKKVLPLVDANGHLAGMFLFTDIARIRSGNSAMHNVDQQGRLRVAAAVGTGSEALHRVELLVKHADVIVIDTAHGDSAQVIETLREIKRSYDIDVVVGNVSEGSSARSLYLAGADGIKVGQGPGSICTTRVVSGIGCPQVTAVFSVVNAVEGSGIPVCADGGIENSGDITIAIGAGADSVMLGKLLAGTKEAPGIVEFHSGAPMKLYRGMGSLAAMKSSQGARERYRQSEGAPDKLVPEGVEAAVTYIGDVETAMHQYLGGLRAGMGYVGVATIQELQARADFYRISAAGIKESHPHGVQILREAPNYQRRES
jgi:IMP dehydrogenase